MTQTPGLTTIDRRARRLCRADEFPYTRRKSYSQHGTRVTVSPFAFTTTASPHTACGKSLLALGLTWDSVGLDFVYYLK